MMFEIRNGLQLVCRTESIDCAANVASRYERKWYEVERQSDGSDRDVGVWEMGEHSCYEYRPL